MIGIRFIGISVQKKNLELERRLMYNNAKIRLWVITLLEEQYEAH